MKENEFYLWFRSKFCSPKLWSAGFLLWILYAVIIIEHTLIRWNSPASNIIVLPEGSSFGTLNTKVNKNISFHFNSLFVSSKKVMWICNLYALHVYKPQVQSAYLSLLIKSFVITWIISGSWDLPGEFLPNIKQTAVSWWKFLHWYWHNRS